MTKYKTYNYPAKRQPAKGTITFTEKSPVKPQIRPSIKAIVPFNRLAMGNSKTNKS